MENLVLASTGVGIDIQDLLLSGDFTLEFRLYFSPDQPITNEDGVVSAGSFGNGNDINFQEGKLNLYSSSFGGDGVVIQSTTVAQSGRWDHYAIRRENGQTQIFINGEVNSTSTQNWTDDFAISQIAQSLNGGLHGQIDELRIWNIARSETEIQNNMDRSVAPNSSGLERYYRFDDEPAGHIVDATGNAETGHDLHPPSGVSIVSAAETTASSSGEFIDTPVVNGLFLPTDMAFLPDGRMLVIEKGGLVKIVEDPAEPNSDIQVYMDLSNSVLDSEERGLLAIEIDPNFETNGYFYLFYTNDIEDKTTISRFQHLENAGGTASRGRLNSETVLWQEHDVTSSCCHQGGGLAIAYEPIGNNDPSPYKLYITVGEEFAGRNSQDLGHDDGKVHRVNLTDGSIPIDNPYYEASTATNYTPQVDTSSAINSAGIIQTIYSYGLRNPFRASYDQQSQTLFVGEVGGNSNQTAKEDIHIASPGANHGWPANEGFFNPSGDPGNPIHSYNHLNGPGQGDTTANGGAAVTGGVVYRGDDFPDQYQGAYFYGDWVRKWIRYLELDYSGETPVVVEDHFFKNATGQVLSFEQAPDGSLYYLTTFRTGNTFTFEGAVNRLEWSQDNTAPIGNGIILSPEELNSSTAPHTVTFEADVTDPDGDALTYQWSFGDGTDLDGDGIGDTATSTEANPTYTYTAKGEYTVELVVTDAQGAAKVFDPQKIIVGQKPEVTITSPPNGGLFRAGETITFTGFATDPEDGSLSGDSLVWSAVFLHNAHTHPGIEGVANQTNGISFLIEDFGHDYSSNTGYEVFLTATDSDGISTTESVIIRPEKVDITFDAPISNYTFLLDGLSYSGDYTHDTIINFNHTIEAQESYIFNGLQYNFSHWEDDISNNNRVRDFVVPETDTTFRPIYTPGTSVNQALALDGTGGVDVPDLTLSGDFTIEAWVKFATGDTISNVDGIVSSGVFGDGNSLNFFQNKARIYSSSYEFGIDPVIANEASGTGQWTHYAFVRENGIAQIYLDGELNATSPESWNGDFYIDQIGKGIPAGGLNGELDELRIWSIARSQTEIESNKGISIDSSISGLERYYQFDNGMVDLTGNSNEASLPGYAQLVESTIPFDGGTPGNSNPVAIDDTATVLEGSTSHLHILDNDYDSDGSLNPQMVEILVQPSHGSLEIIDTQAELDERGLNITHFGHAEYTPESGFTGTDTFTYRVQDNQGAWSNPATMTVTVEPESVTPDVNQALALNGSGGVDVPDLTLSGDFTIEAWVKFSEGEIINNQDKIVGSGIFGDGSSLNFYQNKARIYSSSYEFGNDPVIASQVSGTGQWQHYAFVREDGIAQIYLDGVLDSTSPQSWNGDFLIDKIGAASAAVGLDGELDELRIWSIARSQAEIENHKGMGIDSSISGLERYYQFDNGIVDLTGNSNEVTLPGYAQLVESTIPSEDGNHGDHDHGGHDHGDHSNSNPVAVDDTATVLEGSTNHLHILDNDYDPDGSLNPQMVEILVQPNNGSLEIIDTQAELDERGLSTNHFGHAEYIPEPGFTGTDTFTYRVQDDQGAWSNSATMTLTIEPESVTPDVNQTLALDGTGGVDVPDLTLSGDFTIEAWVKFTEGDTISNADGIVSSGVFGDGNSLNFFQNKARIYSSSYQFGIDPVIANEASGTEQWQHYAFVRENGIAQIYLDGVLDATSPESWNGDFYIDQIGKGIPAGGLNGELDELRIWSIARSQAEIENHKGIGIDSSLSGLERYYQFDNGIVDLTGNSNEVALPDYAQLVESNVPIDIF